MFINTFWRNTGGCHVCKHRGQRSAPPARLLQLGHNVYKHDGDPEQR
ncbi:hypothetical protein HWI77_19165 (plasmid) [Acinetobacter venetianus]|nr:hypothetical protein HWI77_19165 [Acinetobacter venetianus]